MKTYNIETALSNVIRATVEYAKPAATEEEAQERADILNKAILDFGKTFDSAVEARVKQQRIADCFEKPPIDRSTMFNMK